MYGTSGADTSVDEDNTVMKTGHGIIMEQVSLENMTYFPDTRRSDHTSHVFQKDIPHFSSCHIQ